MMNSSNRGAPTPSKIFHPGTERTKTKAGNIKNIRKRYTSANQRYFAVVFPRAFDRGIGKRMKGMGQKIKIAEMLKKRWQKASCRPFLKPCPSFDDASAANRPVAVVPMLEPKVSGYMRSSLISPMPTIGVNVDVKMELLWTRIVKPAPTRRDRYPAKVDTQHLSSACTPMLTIFLMMMAIFPCSKEWRSLTITTKQMQRMTKAMISRITPATESDRFVLENSAEPAKENSYLVCYIICQKV